MNNHDQYEVYQPKPGGIDALVSRSKGWVQFAIAIVCLACAIVALFAFGKVLTGDTQFRLVEAMSPFAIGFMALITSILFFVDFFKIRRSVRQSRSL